MDFVEWLHSRGGKVSAHLDLFRQLENGDRGVVARNDIAEGELLLLLPITCTLYIPKDEEFSKAPDSYPPAVRYLRESHPGLSPFLATTLVLMSEMARGSASPWLAYVATLPPSCPDCLLHWTAEEKEELEGTSLEESGPDPAADVYRRHVAPILAARPDLWPSLASTATAAGAAGPEAGAGAKAEGAAAAVAGPGGEDAGLQAFVRTAGLVQSRAFHLEAENWVSGAKEISKLEGGATQVFLLPGIDMINHSHNPARRNARLERLNVAQAAAASLVPEGKEAAEGAAQKGVEAYFVMRADKPIKPGEEVLHTYGNLSDAQLLQTYGFVDSEDDFRPPATAAATQTSPPKSDSKKRARAGKGAGAEAEEGAGGGGYRNPYNAVLVPWSAVEEVCTGLLRSLDQAPSAALQRAKRDFLAAAGVLQQAAPEATQFVLLAQEPLPEELLTAVQVILMTKDEFNELKREFGGQAEGAVKSAKAAKGGAKAAKGGKKGGKAAAAAGVPGGEAAAEAEGKGEGQGESKGQQLPKLSLGTALLEEDEDFAEMVCIAALQVLESCMERYPTSVKDDVRLLRSADCEGRERLAVRVRLGEKDVIQLAKKAVVELMRRLRDGTAGKPQGGAEEEGAGGSEGGAQGEGDKKESEGGEKAAGGRKPASKKQRRGVGAEKADEEGDGGEGEEDGEDDDNDEEDDAAEGDDGDDGLLMGSDDSDKVGYGPVDYDDGIGEAHDRGKAHPAPKDDD